MDFFRFTWHLNTFLSSQKWSQLPSMFDLSKNTGSSLRPSLALLLLLLLNAFPPPIKADFPINLADIPCGKGALKARSSRIIGGSSLLNRVTVTPRQNRCDRPVPLGRQAPQKDSKLAQGSNSEFVSGSEKEFWNSRPHTSPINIYLLWLFCQFSRSTVEAHSSPQGMSLQLPTVSQSGNKEQGN